MKKETFDAMMAAYLQQHLALNVETTRHYTSGMPHALGPGDTCTERHTVQLVLDGVVISSVSF